jgi:hypothetical protein
VVAVVVRQKDPAHVLRVDQRKNLLQPPLAMDGGAGIDDDRLAGSA